MRPNTSFEEQLDGRLQRVLDIQCTGHSTGVGHHRSLHRPPQVTALPYWGGGGGLYNYAL